MASSIHVSASADESSTAIDPASYKMAARTPEVDAAIAHAQRFLDEGRPDKALAAVNKSHLKSPWITNAIAACHIRSGNPVVAVEILRNLVVEGHIHLRKDIPTVFKINFAAALLASGNFEGFETTLWEIGADPHPAVQKYQDAYQNWKSRLSLWDRMKLSLGSHPSRPYSSDTPLGELI